VALTGWGQQQDRQRTSAAGFDVHLVKPVTEFDLFHAIASARTGQSTTPGPAFIE
jgi:CheY-like chemotaxis protein